jgi:hypothetical protein
MVYNLHLTPIVETFTSAAREMFSNTYTQSVADAAVGMILQNISWSGMWDFLRTYFQKNHGTQIDEIEITPLIFYSKSHQRYENGREVSQGDEKRNINISFMNGREEIMVSIEPTLSAKKGYLISESKKMLFYKGLDQNYLFKVKLDDYDEIETFELEMPYHKLRLIYH